MSEKIYNPKNYIIRDFLDSDINELLNLWSLTNLGGAHRGDDINVIKRTINNGGYLQVLIVNNILIGSAWLTNDFRRLYLHHFAIHPNYQNQGYGSILTKKCIEIAKNKKLQLKLEVHKDNVKAIELYKKNGFMYLGDYDVYIIRDL